MLLKALKIAHTDDQGYKQHWILYWLRGNKDYGFGTSNEYIAYAILDLARDEVRRYLANQGSHIINQHIEEANEAPADSSDNEKDNTRLISDVLARWNPITLI